MVKAGIILERNGRFSESIARLSGFSTTGCAHIQRSVWKATRRFAMMSAKKNRRKSKKEENSMEFSEKLLTLRKAKNLTQEELAERLNVSRQSVSKWESGQAVPELDKIVAMSTVFDVTTDYLLKSSEIDDLSVKTEMLEKQQEQMLAREQRQQKIRECVLYGVVIYLVFFAVWFLERALFWDYIFWESDIHIGTLGIVAAEFLAATAAVVFVCARKLKGEKR